MQCPALSVLSINQRYCESDSGLVTQYFAQGFQIRFQLFLYALQCVIHRFWPAAERGGNLLIAMPFKEKLQHVLFKRRKHGIQHFCHVRHAFAAYYQLLRIIRARGRHCVYQRALGFVIRGLIKGYLCCQRN